MNPAAAIGVLAKEPGPGRSKTRLSPPFNLEECAQLAAAMLSDVLQAVVSTPAPRRILVLEGSPGPWLPPGFEVISQRGHGHAERIGAAFVDIGQPALLIGMDTPQVTSGLLQHAAQRLAAPGIDAVLGPATDGGWWLAGLNRPDASAFVDVPMSRPDTLAHQRRCFKARGLRWSEVDELADVDDAAAAAEVASKNPETLFARLFQDLRAADLALSE